MKILHLYYDIMNLYGDYGNVSVLERVLNQSGADCEIVKKSLGDSFDFNDCDFVFMGSAIFDDLVSEFTKNSCSRIL